MLKLGAIFITTASIMLLAPTATFAQGVVPSCGGNIKPIPATEKEVIASKGVIKLGELTCPIEQSGITAEFGQAKIDLNSMWCRGKAGQCGSYRSSVEELDPKFAVCAAKFLKEIRQRDGSICIESAFRSTAHQKALCSGQVCGKVSGPCAAAGTSKHQSGRAIDISKPGYNTLPPWVHQMAKQSGNISFPVRNDDGHMEPANSTAGDCASPGFIAPGNGTGLIASPSQNFANTVRQALGMQPAQLASPAQQATPSQPLAQSSSPLSSFNSMPTPLVSDSLVTTGTLATTSSIGERLNELVNGVRATTSTQNATSVPLVINANDVGGVASIGNNNQQSGTAWIGGGVTQNTFGGGTQQFQNVPATTLTRYQSVLSSLRSALELMLAYLRPFNRPSNEAYVRE
jgi:hypothetical protein